MIKKAGTYRAKAVETTLGHSKTKGTPFVGVMFEIATGEYAGQRVKWEGWLTEKTQERVIESLQHCGWTGDDLSVFAKPSGFSELPAEVELVVEMEPDQKEPNKEWPKVQWVNRIGAGPKFAGEAMGAAEAADFGKKFRGLALTMKAKAGAPKSEDKKDDGIPF